VPAARDRAEIEEDVVRSRHLRIAALALAVGSTAAMQLLGSVDVMAQAGPPIRPHQVYGADVNGHSPSSGRVIIVMNCQLPLKSGETGHPASGQTVRVFLATSVAKSGTGKTGPHGHEIAVFFNAPPPAPVIGSPTSAGGGPLYFHEYRTKQIPTSEVFPCNGKGNVFFIPFPMGPGNGTDVVVPVRYVDPLPPLVQVR
jgi:hypothetical protein